MYRKLHLVALLAATSCSLSKIDVATLVVTRAGEGRVTATPGIDCGDDCRQSYAKGSLVTLTASAARGSRFAGWGGACAGAGSCVLTLDADKAVSAAFEPVSTSTGTARRLTVTRIGPGTVTSTPAAIACGAACSADFPQGARVTLGARPAPGSLFTGWSGDCAGTLECTLTMDAARNVGARFEAEPVLLVIARAGRGAGHLRRDPGNVRCDDSCAERLPRGTMVTLTASAAEGSMFTGWTGGPCAGTVACTFTLDAETTVTGTFDRARFELEVTRSGTGGGAITSDPAGIECGNQCSALWDAGTEVILTAAPDAGSTFTGFSGDCSGTAPCVVRMSRARSVRASFELRSHTVSVTREGDGAGTVTSRPLGVDCGTRCSATFPYLTAVELTAAPGMGSTFDGWSGDCTGTGGCAPVLDADRRVVARFSRVRPRLAVTTGGNGLGTVTSVPAGIRCGADCEERYLLGTRVRLTATPTTGSRLVEWTGDCTGSAACDLVMDGDHQVGATFELEGRLTVTVAGRGTVASTPAGIRCPGACEAVFPTGTRVTLDATPDAGAELEGFSGACSGVACSVMVGGPVSVGASFRDSPVVRVGLSGRGAGRVRSTPAAIDCGSTCRASFPFGSTVTLTASAAAGSAFTGWIGDCSGTAPCVLSLSTGTRTTTATFDLLRRLTVALAGAGSGSVRSTPAGIDCGADCTETLVQGTMITLEATPAQGSRFAGWTGACSGTGACTVTLDGDRTATARFELERHTLAVAIAGTGTGTVTGMGIRCGADCTEVFDDGAMVTLTAQAGRSSFFAGWTGACSGRNPTCSVSIAAGKAVAARFESTYALLSAGTFSMGSPDGEPGRRADEGPLRFVRHSASVWLKATEVTRAEWVSVMGPRAFAGPACDDCPADGISWEDAVAYLNALSARAGLDPCYLPQGGGGFFFTGVACTGYRFPTEAEWERAARAETTTAFSTGPITAAGDTCAQDPALDTAAWYCATSGGRLRPVASLTPNAYGLFDVHGNAAEWVHDPYDAAAYAATGPNVLDPIGPAPSAMSTRGLRGGSFASLAREVRSAARAAGDPTARLPGVGLRPARSSFVAFGPASYAMGSPPNDAGFLPDQGPVHPVAITRGFNLASVEVVQGALQAVSLPNPSGFPACGERCPADRVSWELAVTYANVLSNAHGLETCYVNVLGTFGLTSPTCTGYRLPTEAEWERAARPGGSTGFNGAPMTGSGCFDPALDAAGWYCGNAMSTTHPVAARAPSPFGLFDVHGDVAEWVHDAYDPSFYSRSPVRNPILEGSSGADRVVRGGGFMDGAELSRAVARRGLSPLAQDPNVGFRLARSTCPAQGSDQVPALGAPEARRGASAIFTGREVIVFGGVSESTGTVLASGGRWDAFTRDWAPLVTTAGLSARTGHAAAWTGEEMLVFGGATAAAATAPALGDLHRFDPAVNGWAQIPSMLSARRDVASAWTGAEWVLFGGSDGTRALGGGARFVPGPDAWLPMQAGPLAPRSGAAALWTGSRVLVAGGLLDGGPFATDAALYDPATDRWSAAMPAVGCGGPARAVLAGEYAVVASAAGWCKLHLPTGGWSTVSDRPGSRALRGPDEAIFASSGAEVLVFGGSPQAADAAFDLYEPASASWREVMLVGARPGPRSGGAGVWSGCGLFLWSGGSADGFLLRP